MLLHAIIIQEFHIHRLAILDMVLVLLLLLLVPHVLLAQQTLQIVEPLHHVVVTQAQISVPLIVLMAMLPTQLPLQHVLLVQLILLHAIIIQEFHIHRLAILDMVLVLLLLLLVPHVLLAQQTLQIMDPLHHVVVTQAQVSVPLIVLMAMLPTQLPLQHVLLVLLILLHVIIIQELHIH